MLENLQKYEVILASNSPRRRELLTNLGVTFTPFVIFGIDESYPPELKGEDVALYVAKKKAAAYKEHIRDNRLIITADTIVSTSEKVLGKPKDEQEAREMLRLISGKEHTVTTAFTLSVSFPLTRPARTAFKNGLGWQQLNLSKGLIPTWLVCRRSSYLRR